LKGFSQGLQHAKAIIRPEFIDIRLKKEISFQSAAEHGTVRNVFFRGTSWQVEVEVGSCRLFGYRSSEQETLKPGDEVFVLIHRLYQYNAESTQMKENSLKFDPQPIYI
jgi:sulfate transport system ATP-binding protein